MVAWTMQADRPAMFDGLIRRQEWNRVDAFGKFAEKIADSGPVSTWVIRGNGEGDIVVYLLDRDGQPRHLRSGKAVDLLLEMLAGCDRDLVINRIAYPRSPYCYGFGNVSWRHVADVVAGRVGIYNRAAYRRIVDFHRHCEQTPIWRYLWFPKWQHYDKIELTELGSVVDQEHRQPETS